jgi:enoyl-CoA hydratase
VTSGDVIVETASPTVGVIRLNRPPVHNALTAGMVGRLLAALERLAADQRIRAVIVTGTGERSFCAGADLDELAGLGPGEALRLLTSGQQAFRRIEQLPVPVIAAVNGLALGGGFELALSCSFMLVSEQAQLGLPETGLGLIPGYGGTQRLTRLAGPTVARFVMVTGRRVSAERAYQLGLTPLPPLPAAELMPAALELAQEIAARGPTAVQAVLRLTGRALDGSLDDGLTLESAHAALAACGAESAEGIAAFRQKRSASFTTQPAGTIH